MMLYKIFLTQVILFSAVPIFSQSSPPILQDGQYYKFELNPNAETFTFLFQNPQNPAQSTTETNSFTVIFQENVPGDSTMSLKISRDSNFVFDSNVLQQTDINIFNFKFQEMGGLLTLILHPSALILEQNLTCYVVFNTHPILVKQPDFLDFGTFIYTKQSLSETYSPNKMYNTYQINILQNGYLLLKKYDCIGSVELVLTKIFNEKDPLTQAIVFQDLIQPSQGDSLQNYKCNERVYQVEVGTYYVFLLPTNGLSLKVGDQQKTYYSLQSQFTTIAPAIFILPGRAMKNSETLQIESDLDNLEDLKITFYPLFSGVKHSFDLNVTYNIFLSSVSMVTNYYSKCGINAPKLQDFEIREGQISELQFENLKSVQTNQQFSYEIKGVNLKNMDLSVSLEVSLEQKSVEGFVSAKIFYTSVMMTNRNGTQIDSNLILIITGGVVFLLAIPIWNFVWRFINNRRKKKGTEKPEILGQSKRDKEKLKSKDSLSLGKN